MENTELQLKLFTQTIYEIRLLLAHHLGSNSKENESESLAAHLAYALHNEALAVVENRNVELDVKNIQKSISSACSKYNAQQVNLKFEKLMSIENS